MRLPTSSFEDKPVKRGLRPFRLWNSIEKRDVPRRYYSTLRRAFNGALLMIRWEPVGVTYEVYNATTLKWLGTYRRGVNTIEFTKE